MIDIHSPTWEHIQPILKTLIKTNCNKTWSPTVPVHEIVLSISVEPYCMSSRMIPASARQAI